MLQRLERARTTVLIKERKKKENDSWKKKKAEGISYRNISSQIKKKCQFRSAL